ncbi:hypothetical protein BDZ89DRAFT_1067829, partial [Hymenopellis radicata]
MLLDRAWLRFLAARPCISFLIGTCATWRPYLSPQTYFWCLYPESGLLTTLRTLVSIFTSNLRQCSLAAFRCLLIKISVSRIFLRFCHS